MQSTIRRRFAAITGYDRWCVPSALSAVTGWSTDVIRCLILGTSPYTTPSRPKSGSWEGVYQSETLQTLHAMGLETQTKGFGRGYGKSVYSRHDERPTLAQWCREHPTGQFLISAGHHMMAYRDGVVIDNGSWASRDGVHWTGMQKGKRARMTQAVELDNVDWF